MRVVIAEDAVLLRAGVQRLLADEGIETVAAVDNGDDLIAAVTEHKPDLAIVDISLPGKTGLELIKDLRAQFPRLPVLVLSMHNELIYAERALRAGARGYVMKQEGGKILVHAIREVLSGQVYVTQQMSISILGRLSDGRARLASSPMENLTEREFEVLQLIGQGLTTRQIAERLHVSVKTVEVHRVHIKEKLQLKTESALMRWAMSWQPARV